MEKVRLARGGLSAGRRSPGSRPWQLPGSSWGWRGAQRPRPRWHGGPKGGTGCMQRAGKPGSSPLHPTGAEVSRARLGLEGSPSLVPHQERQSGGDTHHGAVGHPKMLPWSRRNPATLLPWCWGPVAHGWMVLCHLLAAASLLCPHPHPALAFLSIPQAQVGGGPRARGEGKPPAPLPGRAAPAPVPRVPQSCQAAAAPLGTPSRPQHPLPPRTRRPHQIFVFEWK